MDESHQTVPQVGGMYEGDRSRKQVLVEYGFRLPSALDNRPLTFDEWERRVGLHERRSRSPPSRRRPQKDCAAHGASSGSLSFWPHLAATTEPPTSPGGRAAARCVFVSATPGPYELEIAAASSSSRSSGRPGWSIR